MPGQGVIEWFYRKCYKKSVRINKNCPHALYRCCYHTTKHITLQDWKKSGVCANTITIEKKAGCSCIQAYSVGKRGKNMENREFHEEQAYLTRVEAYIDKRIRQLTDKEEELRKDIGAGRKAMWEEGRHGVCDFDDVVDLYLHSEVIVSDEKQYVENLKELQRLQKMKENPYFARMDVVEEEFPEEMALYIGAVGLRDDKTYDMYVCDWRAPISALFYGFDVGKAWYEVEGRPVRVELKRKRQIQIAGGKLQSIYDTDSVMHDVILGEILSQNTGNKLKVIVSSIQKEQNTAIRKTDCQAVLIYGPAGSGKTSVGLHRLAYILYHQRDKLTAEDIVILSNNHIYHSYVSGILPALCEDEVSHTIFHELLRKFLPKGIFVESYYAQYGALRMADIEIGKQTIADKMQDENSVTVQERKNWLELKYSVELLEFINDYFAEYEFLTLPLKYRGQVIVSAKELQSKFKRNKYGSFRGAFEGLLETVKKLYEDYFEDNKEQICEEIEAKMQEYVSAQELDILFMKAKRRVTQEMIEALKEKNMLGAQEQLLRIMKGFVKQADVEKTIGDKMIRKLQADLGQRHLWYEDALLYVLVRIHMGEVTPFRNVLHVLIDEAQDYHILQLTILKLLYPKSSFTLLADVCQAISPLTTIQSYKDFTAIFGEELECMPLLKSYRSSGAINALAFCLMEKFHPDYAKKYSYFQREGKMPQYIITTDKTATILKKLKELHHYNLVGIITRSDKEAVRLYHRLCEAGEQVQLITGPHDEMKEQVIIMPLIFTKGLEFDAVLVSGMVNTQNTVNRQAAEMYLACTRALHELFFIEKEQLPKEMDVCNIYIELVYE